MQSPVANDEPQTQQERGELSEQTSHSKALRDLRVSTEVEWVLWTRDAAGEWTLPSEKEEGSDFVGLNFHPAWQGHLEEAYGRQDVVVTQSAPDQWWIASPRVEAFTKTDDVFAAVVDGQKNGYVKKLAEMHLLHQRDRFRVEQLESENAQFAQQVGDDFEEMTFLRTMAENLAVSDTSLGIKEVVKRSFEMLYGILGAEVLCFVEKDTSGKERCTIRRNTKNTVACSSLESCTELAKRYCSLVDSGPLVRNDLTSELDKPSLNGAEQLLIVPVQTSVRHFGWFMAINRGPGFTQHGKAPLLCASVHEFGTWEASLLSTAASVIASHASNLEHLREKGKLLVNVVRSMVSAVEAKDAYTCGHSERVALYTKRLAQHLSYDEEAAERVYLTGLLHDVGKIGISDATLNKAGKLTDEEFAEIKEHPDHGWSILCELRQLAYVLPGVLHHHERFDGKGYPDGLSGKDIPLDARIMAVADAYDAMTSNRAYRQGMAH
ncbi:MAG: HD-GYP domain-containing protein, partial [Lacipirellulaceae bacterium]